MTTQAANGRARFCAWAVFVSMAGTTMAFQVYHSVELGRMPAPLAVLYGVVPLCISMLLIEVVSGWEGAPKWTPAAAYLIIAGAMFLSAAATGAVVLRAAPPHSSLLFGVLLDGAAILAARFLMTATRPVPHRASSGPPAGTGTGTGERQETVPPPVPAPVPSPAAAPARTAASTAPPKEGAGPVPAERISGTLLDDARSYRDELAAAGERLTKDKLRLRLAVGSGKALEILRALNDDDQDDGTSEAVV